MRYGLDKLFFPFIYWNAIRLQHFAEKMLRDRLAIVGTEGKMNDFLEYVVNAKDADGTPIHSGKVELALECVNLIIGGKSVRFCVQVVYRESRKADLCEHRRL